MKFKAVMGSAFLTFICVNGCSASWAENAGATYKPYSADGNEVTGTLVQQSDGSLDLYGNDSRFYNIMPAPQHRDRREEAREHQQAIEDHELKQCIPIYTDCHEKKKQFACDLFRYICQDVSVDSIQYAIRAKHEEAVKQHDKEIQLRKKKQFDMCVTAKTACEDDIEVPSFAIGAKEIAGRPCEYLEKKCKGSDVFEERFHPEEVIKTGESQVQEIRHANICLNARIACKYKYTLPPTATGVLDIADQPCDYLEDECHDLESQKLLLEIRPKK